MTPPSVSQLLRTIFPMGEPDEAGVQPEYTILFPPTMLWSNFQRPHNILTQLARHYPVRCLFNDWTVGERRSEGGRLIVTRKAFRARYHRRPLVYYFSIPEKLAYVNRYRLRPELTVFELMDVPEREFAEWKADLPRALRAADIVRTTGPAISEYLREHFSAALGDKQVSTSRNGVDLELFDPDGAFERPPELRHVRKPVLGFYGNLDWWIDWGLIGRLARLDEYQVVIIGDTEGQRDKIPPELRESSILWLGRKPVTELPGYLACFDAALFPFVVNEMTDAVDPLKIWEYLAFGTPVLATRTAFIAERAELFHLIDEGNAPDAVAGALATAKDPTLVAVRKSAAADRDWRAISGELHREITDKLAAKRT